MPIHQNQDGTWQWGKSGKKYKKKQDAIKQMKAIFANGYVEKHASYTDVLGIMKKAASEWTAGQARRSAATQALKDVKQLVLDPMATLKEYTGKNPYMLVKNKLGLPYTFKDIASARESYDTSPTGYLKNPQIARRNALAMKQSGGNRYATNNGAAGAFQMRPIAMTYGKRQGFIPADATVNDLFKPGNTYGFNYFSHVNKNNNLDLVAYLRHFKGPNAYRNRAKDLAFKKMYPTQELWAASIPQVRKYWKLLARQNKLAQKASPVPVAK